MITLGTFSLEDDYTRLYLKSNPYLNQLLRYLQEKSFGKAYVRFDRTEDSLYIYLGDHPKAFIEEILLPWIRNWATWSEVEKSITFIPHELAIVISPMQGVRMEAP